MPTFTSDSVILTVAEYKALVEAKVWLEALEAAGVDNWDGISFAHEIFEEGTLNEA